MADPQPGGAAGPSPYFESQLAQQRRSWERSRERQDADWRRWGEGALRALDAQERLYRAGLPTRAATALVRQGHETVEGVVNLPDADLLLIRNLGPKGAAAVRVLRPFYPPPIPPALPEWLFEE